MTPGGAQSTVGTTPAGRRSVALFYGAALACLLVERAVVRALGAWWGGAAFLAVGGGLGLLELRTTPRHGRLRDPFLRLGCWLHRRWGWAGFLVNAVLTGGAPGVAVALRREDHPHRVPLTLLAAVLFASFWATLWERVG